jgi:hypothetical protein
MLREGAIVDADETYMADRGTTMAVLVKRPILALVERGGRVQTFYIPIAEKRHDRGALNSL